jgi:predicted nucleic acid-binding protein
MGSYFFDTSAIVKRYVPEQGQSLILTLCDPKQGHDLYISQATLVETVASICRKTRMQLITTAERDSLIEIFRRHSQRVYSIRRVNTAIYTAAGDLCRIHNLRAYDAIQLASALNLRARAIENQVSPPVFVCADANLLNIALAEGFSIENPNNYP